MGFVLDSYWSFNVSGWDSADFVWMFVISVAMFFDSAWILCDLLGGLVMLVGILMFWCGSCDFDWVCCDSAVCLDDSGGDYCDLVWDSAVFCVAVCDFGWGVF